jgi:hypothetical protein
MRCQFTLLSNSTRCAVLITKIAPFGDPCRSMPNGADARIGRPNWTLVHFKISAAPAPINLGLKRSGVRHGGEYARRRAGFGCYYFGKRRTNRRFLRLVISTPLMT